MNHYATIHDRFHILHPDGPLFTCCGFEVSHDEVHDVPEQDREKICYDCVHWNSIVSALTWRLHWAMKDMKRTALDALRRTSELSPELNKDAYDYINSHHVIEVQTGPGSSRLETIKNEEFKE